MYSRLLEAASLESLHAHRPRNAGMNRSMPGARPQDVHFPHIQQNLSYEYDGLCLRMES
jgi:hypothetical protein